MRRLDSIGESGESFFEGERRKSSWIFEGKLKVAGPFGDEGKWIGLFIFDCETKEEVEKLLKTDPAVAAGRLNYEIHPWWTAATGSFTPGKPAKPGQ